MSRDILDPLGRRRCGSRSARSRAPSPRSVIEGAGFTNFETALTLTPTKGAAAIDGFLAHSRGSLEAWAENNELTLDPIQGFEGSVKAEFAKLSNVRFATGDEMGGAYLFGRAKDCYVAVVIQNYSDG